MNKKVNIIIALISIVFLALCVGFMRDDSFGGRSSTETVYGGAITSTEIEDKTTMDVNLPGGLVGSELDNATTLTATAAALGDMVADTYYLTVTSVDDDGGQTLSSAEMTCTVAPATTTSCTIAATVNSDAASTRIWLSTTSGTYTQYWTNSATSSTNISTSTGSSFTTATFPEANTAYNEIPADRWNYDYAAAATADNVVKASPGILHAIVLGKWVTNGTVECSDHISDGDGNVQIFLTAGSTDVGGFPKTILVDAWFAAGITCDTIGLTQVSFLYR